MSIFQELYDSEINVQIDWFWDGGFNVALGDALNGFQDSATVDSWQTLEIWLRLKAVEHYPDSDFAKAQAALAPTPPA